MTDSQASALLKALVDSVIDSIGVAGDHGAPGGILYAGLMVAGINYDQYVRLMHFVVSTGRVTRKGDLYFIVNNTF